MNTGLPVGSPLVSRLDLELGERLGEGPIIEITSRGDRLDGQ